MPHGQNVVGTANRHIGPLMAGTADDLSSSSALVVDSNPTSRSVLVSQLRDFGMGSVVQCARLADSRRQLEYRKFDVVLCEHHFAGETASGQDLLDDLRRNQLLPFSTVFIMVTGEATYAKVAEAAESSLDGYLLKPQKANQLGDRLRQARIRKASLQEIFTAIESEDFERAATLCMERFESRGLFWLYAARVGAELLLRIGKPTQAQALYEAVVAAKTLPWAKLGVARSQLDDGQVAKATSTLSNLISEDPTYTDAYDVMGRAQFETGKFDEALATYKMASELTPASITRLQNLGLLTYYSGSHEEAEKLLDKTTRLGLDSKMFDCQTLVLLAFMRLQSGDRKGLQRCRDDFVRLNERNPDSLRHQRLADIVEALHLIHQHQYAPAVDAVRAMCKTVKSPEFDFESASNLLALMVQLASKDIQLNEVDSVVDTIGMRYCNNRAMTELLVGTANTYPLYADRIRTASAKILKINEQAMQLSMGGDPKAAVKNLIFHSNATLNGKLIGNAFLVLNRYAEKIDDAQSMKEIVQDMRTCFAAGSSRPTLGGQQRQAGGLTLRTGSGQAQSKPP
ncbi:response regulator [Rhodoferax sp. PAMC 29310]|uniref:response regulator n=1 Tax=Rhodoferax sp. PAMC 29310 TaxID=2822760 RepID=UPI001F0B683F|nr:response regulator [Rhodoferax sp. PAMC 29310]